MYSRGLGKIGSSAFEHVFLNEIKNGTVIGLHNWVYFLEQEKAGKVDYMGYIKKVDLGSVSVSKFMKNQFLNSVISESSGSCFKILVQWNNEACQWNVCGNIT